MELKLKGVCRDFVQCRYEIRECIINIDIFQGVSLSKHYNGSSFCITREKDINRAITELQSSIFFVSERGFFVSIKSVYDRVPKTSAWLFAFSFFNRTLL